MIKKFRIAEDVDVVMMECIVDEMRDLLRKLVSGEVPNENNYVLSDLMDFCISLIDGQRGEIGVKSGSWCVAPSAKGMPSDARVYLVFFPTYIAIAILTRVLLDYPEITGNYQSMEMFCGGVLSLQRIAGYEDMGLERKQR